MDAEAGIIYDVKILGHESDNGRYYLPEAMQRAKSLYEGAFVNVDHSKDPSARDRSAWLEKVRYEPGDGLRGDLHFLLPLDEFQKHVLWAAEHKPDAYGLSHNARGDGDHKNGVFHVIEITEVRSVDLVADPATNKSLFESRKKGGRMATTFKQLVESAKVKDPALKAGLTKLLEMGDYADMEMAAPDEEGEEPGFADHLTNAIGALVKSTDPADHAKAKKILAILEPEAVEEEDEDEEGDGEKIEEEDDEEEGAAKKKTDESRKAKRSPSTALTEAKAKSYCKLAGLAPDKELLETLQAVTSEDAALKLLEWAKARQTAIPARRGAHSASPGSPGNSKAAAKDYKTFLEQITAG